MKLVQIVRIIVYALKIIGLAPFSQQTNISVNNYPNTCCVGVYRFSKLGLTYNILLLILIQVWAVFSIPLTFSMTHQNSSTMSQFIEAAQTIAFCMTSNVIIISWAFRQNKAACILNELLEVDRLLSDVEKPPLSDKRISIFSLVHIIFNASLWTTLYATQVELASDIFLIILTFYNFIILVIYWFTIQYFLVITLAAMNFKRINNILLKHVKFQTSSYPEQSLNVLSLSSNSSFAVLQLLVIIRARLVDISQDIADFFSLPILLTVACFFTMLVYNLYYLISPVLIPGGGFALASTFNGILWLLIGAYPLMLLCFIVAKASDQAKLTARIVHKLLATPMTQAIKELLTQFSLQLLHEDVSFTACGFFTLDWTMLHSIISATATYLVILIQFQMADEKNDTSTV